MEEIHKLRAQLSNIMKTNFPDVDVEFFANMAPPNALQVRSVPKFPPVKVLKFPLPAESYRFIGR